MKPAPFEYHSPTSVEACLDLLAEYNEEASLLAGGQSLLPLMRFRLAQPGQVITIRGIGGSLRSIRIEDGHLIIGAGVTYAKVQRSADARTACPGLGDDRAYRDACSTKPWHSMWQFFVRPIPLPNFQLWHWPCGKNARVAARASGLSLLKASLSAHM